MLLVSVVVFLLPASCLCPLIFLLYLLTGSELFIMAVPAPVSYEQAIAF